MSTGVWGEEQRTIHVCVDACQDGIPRGHVYSKALSAARPFACLSQFLKEMEQTLDSMEFPKAYTATRTFAPVKPPGLPSPEPEKGAGDLATFVVRVLFRQNASWQGSVTWLEGKQEQSFRSALELIFLINSALEQKQVS